MKILYALLLKLLEIGTFLRLYYTGVIVYYKFLNSFRLKGERECELLSEFIRPGDLVVDIGACYGLYASRMAGLVGGNGKVISFEATPTTFNFTQKIVSEPNVELHNLAISDKRGSVRIALFIAPESCKIIRGLSRIVDENENRVKHFETVNCAPLDELLNNRDRPVSFIKCDVEGHEIPAITGALNIIKQDKPVLLIELAFENVEPMSNILEPLGYEKKQITQHGTLSSNRKEVILTPNYFFIPNTD